MVAGRPSHGTGCGPIVWSPPHQTPAPPRRRQQSRQQLRQLATAATTLAAMAAADRRMPDAATGPLFDRPSGSGHGCESRRVSPTAPPPRGRCTYRGAEGAEGKIHRFGAADESFVLAVGTTPRHLCFNPRGGPGPVGGRRWRARYGGGRGGRSTEGHGGLAHTARRAANHLQLERCTSRARGDVSLLETDSICCMLQHRLSCRPSLPTRWRS